MPNRGRKMMQLTNQINAAMRSRKKIKMEDSDSDDDSDDDSSDFESD